MTRDHLPDEKKFGYEHAIEMRAIRAELAARGVDAFALHFEAIKEYDRRHANDPPYRERQKAWLERCRATQPASTVFNGEELARIIEHFAGANDSVAQSIGAKAARALGLNTDGIS